MRLEDITTGLALTGLEPAVIGSVVAVVPIAEGTGQVIYKTPDGVLKDRLLNRADESNISIATTERPWSFDGDGDAFKLAVEAKRIDLAFLFDPMMAVHTSNVEPLPHQITAVYQSMLPRQPLRFVLADDPGAGKTIMAGLYIRELIMRADSRRILVVAPGSLVEQWRDELFEKFGLQFNVFSSALEAATPTGNPFEDVDHLIVRLDQMARNEELQEKLLAASWDLVIFDEAHKLAAHFFGSKLEKTGRFILAEKLGARTRHLLMLFMDQINQSEKTLVFCATQIHALAVRDLINQMKSSQDPNYCQRVTANDGDLGEQHLRDFQDNEKTIPTILTTSQKLSTGVDARNIRNIVLMRPINSIIEFKQIIGRGTRLYDGKDYFTIFDFVKAYHHFQDKEWDGEALDPEPKVKPAMVPEKLPKLVKESPADYSAKPKIKVKLADGKERTIQHMMMTCFYHPDGTPISAHQFMELLFGQLPEFFKDEAELRALWSAPDTRKKLLQGLAEKGFGHDQLAEMQKIIDAEKSDLFDVLAHVAYALPPVTRAVRAATARVHINTRFTAKQQVFLDFVLQHYITVGVEELDQEKLKPLLHLKYHDSINDAVRDLGKPEEIRKAFVGFQKYLYASAA